MAAPNKIRCVVSSDISSYLSVFGDRAISRGEKIIGQMNMLIRTLKARPVSILYGEMWRDNRTVARKMLSNLTLFGFSDAGYSTLAGRKSQESRILIWGRPVSRDGEIQCLGSPVDFLVDEFQERPRALSAQKLLRCLTWLILDCGCNNFYWNC